MAVTVPELGAWTGTLTGPCASAIICPPFTASPTSTIGRAGAPMCWVIGRTSFDGKGISRTCPGFASFLRSGGWMPPWISKICLMPQPAPALQSRPSLGQSRSGCRARNPQAKASTSVECRLCEGSYRYSRQGRAQRKDRSPYIHR